MLAQEGTVIPQEAKSVFVARVACGPSAASSAPPGCAQVSSAYVSGPDVDALHPSAGAGWPEGVWQP